MYILTEREDRKGAKRQKLIESEDLQQLKQAASFCSPAMKIEIYTGNWKLVWSREKGDVE